MKPCLSSGASCEIPGHEHTLNSHSKFPLSALNIINSCLPSLHCSGNSLFSSYSLSFIHLITPSPSLYVHPIISCHPLPIFFFPGEKVMPDKDLTCDLFRLLQLLCEGHNSGYLPCAETLSQSSHNVYYCKIKNPVLITHT